MAQPGEFPVTLLAIDDDPASLELIQAALENRGLQIFTASDAAAGLNLFRRKHPQIVLLDLVIPGSGGMEVLTEMVAMDPGIDVILMTAHYSTESAVEAIQRGAADYLTKPLAIDKLRQRMDKLVAETGERQRRLRLDRELVESYKFEGMVGRSPQMLDVFARIRRVAPHFRTVLVTGPTGTGKEMAARALHRLSPAGNGPMAVCNCAAVVETLFESELFGYVRGAFTGANQDKIGLVEYAHGGTLFLDEIGEMPLATQAKILRVLQNQEVQRVGSPSVRKVDVRVVAATNRDLRALVAEKKFREDLFYRLSMVEVRLPRLSDRKEDLPLLERHLVERFSEQYQKPVRGLTRRAQAVLSAYPWPGNIRELENVLGHACMMAEEEFIDVRDLPENILGKGAQQALEDEGMITLEELERRHARRVLARMEGNKARAAEILGISRATLYRLISDADDSDQHLDVNRELPS